MHLNVSCNKQTISNLRVLNSGVNQSGTTIKLVKFEYVLERIIINLAVSEISFLEENILLHGNPQKYKTSYNYKITGANGR